MRQRRLIEKQTAELAERAEAAVARQAARAEALVRFAARLSGQLHLEAVLAVVCEETTRALDVPCVAVDLYDEGSLQLEVADRGTGFHQEASLSAGASSGLAGIRDRVGLLGGALALESAPGRGTRLAVELPIDP